MIWNSAKKASLSSTAASIHLAMTGLRDRFEAGKNHWEPRMQPSKWRFRSCPNGNRIHKDYQTHHFFVEKFWFQACSGFFLGVSEFGFLEIIIFSGLGVTILPWLYSICFNSFLLWFDLSKITSQINHQAVVCSIINLSNARSWCFTNHPTIPPGKDRWCNSHVLGKIMAPYFAPPNLGVASSNSKSHHGFILSVPWWWNSSNFHPMMCPEFGPQKKKCLAILRVCDLFEDGSMPLSKLKWPPKLGDEKVTDWITWWVFTPLVDISQRNSPSPHFNISSKKPHLATGQTEICLLRMRSWNLGRQTAKSRSNKKTGGFFSKEVVLGEKTVWHS